MIGRRRGKGGKIYQARTFVRCWKILSHELVMADMGIDGVFMVYVYCLWLISLVLLFE